MSPTQAERSESTRAALLRAARELFAERGYAATAAEDVVRAAGVTRGAMYHHFGGKKDLFRAVHEEMEQEMVAGLAERLSGIEDAWELLVTGVDAFLEQCLDPVLAKIALDEAPSVLGWREWREVDMRFGLGLTSASLQYAMDAGVLREQPVLPLAHLLVSAMGEAGLMIAASEDPAATRDELRGSLVALLEGLRA